MEFALCFKKLSQTCLLIQPAKADKSLYWGLNPNPVFEMVTKLKKQ